MKTRFLLAFLCLLTTGIWHVRAQDFTAANDDGVVLPYVILSDSEVELTGTGADYSGCERIDIPEQVVHDGNTYAVVSIGSNAFTGFRWREDIKEVILPSTVRTIGMSAFGRCSSLERITLSEGLDSIGVSAFKDCAALTEIVFPSTLRSIDRDAFSDCTSLERITFSEGLDSIGSSAFRGCAALAEIVFPSTLRNIGLRAFDGCSSLKRVTIPMGLETLDGSAFEGCTGLTEVVWNAADCAVTGTSDNQLMLSSPIEILTIGENVKRIPNFNLYESSDIAVINYNAASVVQSALCGRNGYSTSSVTINIGETVRDIPAGMFYQLSGVRSVYIPDNVETIGANAFYPTVTLENREPQGPEFSLDRESCSSWGKVYLYAEANGRAVLGDFPGMDVTDDCKFTFPTPLGFMSDVSYYGGDRPSVTLAWSDGTSANRTLYIHGVTDSRRFSLLSQTGNEIDVAVSAMSDDAVPGEAEWTLVLSDEAPAEGETKLTFVVPESEREFWTDVSLCAPEGSIWGDDGMQYEMHGELYAMTEEADGVWSYVLTGSEAFYDGRFRFVGGIGDGYGNYPRATKFLDLPEMPLTYMLQAGTGRSDLYDGIISDMLVSYSCETDHMADADKFSYFLVKGTVDHDAWSLGGDEWSYASGVPVDVDGWLVSPQIDASAASRITVSYQMRISQAATVQDMSNVLQLLVCTDGKTWTQVPMTYPDYGYDVTRWEAFTLDFSEYAGSSSFRFAFRYTGTPEVSPKLSLRKLVISTNETETGDFILLAGDFPQTADHFYDIDGDGVMEYLTYENYYYNNSSDNYTIKIYDHEGRFIRPLPVQGELIAIDDINRDGKPEFVVVSKESGSFMLHLLTVEGKTIAAFHVDDLYSSGIALFDADNDGRTDILCCDLNTDYYNPDAAYSIYYQQPDGSFKPNELIIVTDEEEINNALFAQYGANPIIPPPLNFSGAALASAPPHPSLKDDGAFASKPQYAAALFEYSGPEAVDINMDGLPDLLNLDNGNALLSLGDNRYYFGDFGGDVTVKDLTGDGIPDFVVYDESNKTVYLYIYEGDNSFNKELLMQNFNITGVYCYDFDGDGDVDILLPFDYTYSSQYSFLVFFENQGDGSFKKRERSSEQVMKFYACADFDNDGTYEVLADIPEAILNEDQRYNVKHDLYLIDCLPSFDYAIGETPVIDIPLNTSTSYSEAKGEFLLETSPDVVYGDFDNDGITEYFVDTKGSYSGDIVVDEIGYSRFRGEFAAAQVNAAPHRPAAPTFIHDAASNTLRVQWEPGTDDGTSAVDLTYALRIGTEPGAGDVWFAYASASGKRLRPGEGNAAYDLYEIIDTKSWNTGKYYIAIQTVDPSGLGSEWSEEAVFENNVLSADFNLSPVTLYTIDTLTVSLGLPYRDGYEYAWDFGEKAKVVASTDTEWKVVYDLAGTKTVSLTVTDTEGRSTAVEKQAEVYAVSFADWTGDQRHKGLAYDIDMNGTLDIVGSGYRDNVEVMGVLQNDGKGNFSKVGRTYNSDLQPSSSGIVADVNMDGLPDFVLYSNKGNVFVNEGSFDFTYSFEAFTCDGAGFNSNSGLPYYYDEQKNHVDMNNDGYVDFLYEYNSYGQSIIYENTGDGRTYIRHDLNVSGISVIKMYPYDVDGDGLYDIIIIGNIGDELGLLIYMNEGNFSFSEPVKRVLPQAASRSSNDDFFFGDMNNDGFVDCVDLLDQTGELAVFYSTGEDADFSHKEVLYSYEEYFSGGLNVYDYDNNGYLDVSLGEKIFYFYPDGDIRMAEYESLYDYVTVLGDFDGDGVPDCNAGRTLSRHTNTAPETPANVRAVQRADAIVLAWDEAEDAETPFTQMCYNVSLKIKGESGDDSYIVSPVNGGEDAALSIPLYANYRRATQMEVPINRFRVGETYELKVQSIDMWGMHSPFSETYEFTVESMVGIDAPDETCQLVETVLTYVGTETGEPEWSLDGGQLLSEDGNNVVVAWYETGVKNVSVTVNGKVSTKPINVRETIDMSLTLPKTVVQGAAVPFTLPAVFGEAGRTVGVRASDDKDYSGSATTVFDMYAGGLIVVPEYQLGRNTVVVERRGSSLEARVTFYEDCADENGKVWLELYCLDPVCGEVSWYREVEVIEGNVTPQISIVTVDGATGRNKILWDVPEDLPEGVFESMAIFKETGSTNNFVEIDRVPIDAEMYIDQQSDPTVRKNRYRIALATVYDSYSSMSDVHSSVHVMLNKGMGNDINIVWSAYEGGLIEPYTIMRGDSPDNMQVLATASGYETSYTDRTVGDGESYYYALSYSNIYDDNWIVLNSPMKGAKAVTNTADGLSNVVSSSESNVVTFAESVAVRTIEKQAVLTPDRETLHVYAEIMPAMATYKQVNWTITSGNDLAMIDRSGLLTYTGEGRNGTVTVKASTIDGSGLSATKDISVSGFAPAEVMVESVTLSADDVNLSPQRTTLQVVATVSPADADDKSLTWSVTSGASVVAVDAGGLVTAQGIDGMAVIRATANDGSGAYGEITVYAAGFAPDDVKVESVTLSADDVNLSPQRMTLQVVATVSPDDADDKSLTWSVTSGADVATVDAEGLVTALGKDGTAVIRAAANDGSGVYGEITVYASGFVSVSDAESAETVVYPVPADDYIFIEASRSIERVEVVSMDGAIVKMWHGEYTKIDVSDIAAGLYILKVTFGDGSCGMYRISVF